MANPMLGKGISLGVVKGVEKSKHVVVGGVRRF